MQFVSNEPFSNRLTHPLTIVICDEYYELCLMWLDEIPNVVGSVAFATNIHDKVRV